MISNALQISVTPQEGKKSKTKKSSNKSLIALNTKTSKKQPTHTSNIENSLFATMLLENPKTSSKTSQIKNKTRALSIKSSNKTTPPLPQKTKTNKTTTQQHLNLQLASKAPKPTLQSKSALNEALNLKQDQRTLKDIVKITKDNQLNLSKLELKTNKKVKPTTIQESNPTKITKEQNKNQKPQLQTHKALATSSLALSQSIQQPKDQVQIPATNTHTPIDKDPTLNELLKLTSKATNNPSTANQQEEKKEEIKSQDFINIDLKKETQFKITNAKETLTNFSNRLREEIINYKPPFTKLTMELNPQELGKLEITISKKGKDLQVSVNANNANALQTFIQNQNEFRNTLSTIGFNNVELNFSQGEKQNNPQNQEEQNKKGNKNSLKGNTNDSIVASTMEIKMVQYA